MDIRADLHIHTVLSPCGDLEMSPENILYFAQVQGLNMIGITDHNSTRQAPIIRDYGKTKGIFVLTGAEICSKEEVHALTFFETDEQLTIFQHYLDVHLPDIPNDPEKFGFQVVVDPEEQIIYEEPKLLISALNQSLEEIAHKVRQLDGIFIPAHIDKPCFSILSQLGFVPPDLRYDALELSSHTSLSKFLSGHPELKSASFIQSSDAHYPGDIGKIYTQLKIEDFSFKNIRQSIRNLIS